MSEQEPQKVVYNPPFGGFSVHDDTVRWMRKHGCEIAEELTLPGETYPDGSERDANGFRPATYPREARVRVCEHLVAAVEEGITTDLAVAEVPADTEWVITEYDGGETIREQHRIFPSKEPATGSVCSSDIESVCRMENDE